MAELSLELGRQCALAEHDLHILRSAAALHDVGKTLIPDDVLLKVAPLTDADWAVMRTHPVIGQRMIEAAGLDNSDAIGLIVRHHHERYDGAGYPDGLAGESIPYISRILALVDTYDAMAWSRVYRPALPHDLIMQALAAEQGRQHDSYLYAKFARLIEYSDFNVKRQFGRLAPASGVRPFHRLWGYSDFPTFCRSHSNPSPKAIPSAF